MFEAILWELAEDNPVKKVEMCQEPPGRERYLESHEIDKLLQEAAEHLRPIITIALYTGMRKGEILSLTWSDIDFDLNQIHVKHSKNGDLRRIPMSKEVVDVLRCLCKNQESVFTHCDGSPVKCIKTGFEAAVKRAKIEDFSFHDLRHTFASYMVMNGAELLTVSRILGHKGINMTLRYAHLSPSYQRDAMKGLKLFSAPNLHPLGKTVLASNRVTRYPAKFAGVVELVDTRDLKSLGSQEPCRFKSGLRH